MSRAHEPAEPRPPREIDLHGYHPYTVEPLVVGLVRQAWEMGAPSLRVIHGWGKHRNDFFGPQFVHTNTGFLGLTVRHAFRSKMPTLRRWMYVKFETSDPGVTTVRLRPNPSPTRTDFAALPQLDFP